MLLYFPSGRERDSFIGRRMAPLSKLTGIAGLQANVKRPNEGFGFFAEPKSFGCFKGPESTPKAEECKPRRFTNRKAQRSAPSSSVGPFCFGLLRLAGSYSESGRTQWLEGMNTGEK